MPKEYREGASRSVQPVTGRIRRRDDVFSLCSKPSNEKRNKLEQDPVVQAEALVAETVQRIVRNCPPGNLADVAREDLLALEPHLQRALEALEDIKRRRSLTDKERSQRYTFRVLLTLNE